MCKSCEKQRALETEIRAVVAKYPGTVAVVCSEFIDVDGHGSDGLELSLIHHPDLPSGECPDYWMQMEFWLREHRQQRLANPEQWQVTKSGELDDDIAFGGAA